jgi:hypothetical protein
MNDDASSAAGRPAHISHPVGPDDRTFTEYLAERASRPIGELPDVIHPVLVGAIYTANDLLVDGHRQDLLSHESLLLACPARPGDERQFTCQILARAARLILPAPRQDDQQACTAVAESADVDGDEAGRGILVIRNAATLAYHAQLAADDPGARQHDPGAAGPAWIAARWAPAPIQFLAATIQAYRELTRPAHTS